jgi:class 3 adenylate cyclase
MGLLGICSVLLILIFLLPLALPYIKNALSFQYIRKAVDIERALSAFIRDIMPTKISGYELTRWIGVAVSYVFFNIFMNLRGRFENRLNNLKVISDYENWRSQMQLSDDSNILSPLRDRIKTFQTANKKDREELLKLFAETKKKLDAMGRDLAFLSIDIVDSTGLKEGEEKAAAEYDFREYKNFVEQKLKANGVVKAAWTPDGVMSCFPTVDAAVQAARDVLDGLVGFNKNVKTMRGDFRVRCGINAGYLYFDETLPLEELCDRVIDIAGHMQKQALPNSICIAKPAIEPLQDKEGFVSTSKVVDGYEVYMSDRRKVPRE